MRVTLLFPLLFAVAASAAPASRLPAEWQPLAREVFAELIALDTTHSRGASAASAAIQARLKAAGYADADLIRAGLTPERQNLVVRLHGQGKGKPVLLPVHLDVVDAKRSDWSVDPFVLTEKDGYFYGRGTTDIKEEAAEFVVNLIRWKREGWRPQRDLIFAFTDDEEGGGEQAGLDWLLQNRPELFAGVELAINPDAGGGNLKGGKPITLDLQTSEKVYLSFELSVTDKGGHSSIPTGANPIHKLATALGRLAAHEFPLRTNETTRSYFAAMAAHEPDVALAGDMRALGRHPLDAVAGKRVAATSPYYNALLRTTCVATEISGGHAENALPQLAKATVNCRIHPDEDADVVQAALAGVLAEPALAMRRMDAVRPSPPSPLRRDVLAPLEKVTAQMFPGASIVPAMSTGASDGLYLRNRGVPVYGISGMFTDIDDPRAHGRDERIGVVAYYDGVEFMYRFLKAFAGKP